VIKISAGATPERFAAILRCVYHRGERVLIERDGEVIAAIVPAEDLREMLRHLEGPEDAAEMAPAAVNAC
jgi:antitoxin (DNA-binding transcriptional repressor) of toxin-antitoxin stability system